jgi:ribosomal protein S18 acetylase RimI-like enzyme
MGPETFAVRRMRAEELETIRTWANQEGWNPGVHDAAAFFAADPQGFFVGELDGKPVSCISCVGYDDGFGFLGQYIVHPAARGRGFGVRTWAAGMAHLGGRNVGLDGVLNQQSNYERSGFRFAHQHIRHEGTGGGARPDGVVALSTVPFDQVVAYDRTCFPAARPEFLRSWIALPDSAAFAVVAGGTLRGFGVIRRSVGGHKIGPLFADDAVVAERLLRALWATAPGEPVCIDIPDGTFNPAAEELLQPFSSRELFRTARMYTHQTPVVAASKIFGITTMELG